MKRSVTRQRSKRFCMFVCSLWIITFRWGSVSSSDDAKTAEFRDLPFLFGVMVDGGKQFFPADWLVSFMKDVDRIGLNAVHLTVASDHRFSLSMSDDPRGQQHSDTDGKFFSRSDWRSVVAQARSLRNMTIVPEISVPVYAASWVDLFGSDVVADCPQYVCGAGYAVPLNLHHPNLGKIVELVLRRLVDVLDRPPLLHLGSNDVSMAEPCWKEVADAYRNDNYVTGSKALSTPDYGILEEILEKVLIQTCGYSPDQVIRQGDMEKPGNDETSRIIGKISQYKNHQTALDATGPYLLQPNQLNLAIHAMDRVTGWDIYQQTLEIMEQHWKAERDNPLFRGILISTEAMDYNLFRRRNVLGRLLAVSMAIQATTAWSKDGTRTTQKYRLREEFEQAYLSVCESVFTHNAPATVSQGFCRLLGGTLPQNPMKPDDLDLLPTESYKMLYGKIWNGMKDDLCKHLTETKDLLQLQSVSGPVKHQIQQIAFSRYWWSLGKEQNQDAVQAEISAEMSPQENDEEDEDDEIEPSEMRRHRNTNREDTKPQLLHESLKTSGVERRGLVVDMVKYAASRKELDNLMKVMVALGLNTLQLSLLNGLGCSLQLGDTKMLYHVVPTPKNFGEGPSDKTLSMLVKKAQYFGIEIIPEITTTTRATGWYHAGFLVGCPKTLCDSGEIANDVTRGSLLPILVDMIRSLYRIFHPSSPYIHLGSDERALSQACWNESGKVPDYDVFESKLSEMLASKGWYDSSKILRWENSEGVHYPNRTGDMTQYQYRIPTDSDSPMFGSIFLDNFTDPWTVYSTTRAWVASTPTGLLTRMTEVSLKDVAENKPKLIAFAAGLSSTLPPMKKEEELDAFLADICENHSTWCKLSPVAKKKPRGKEPSRLDSICKSITHSSAVTVMRTIPASVAVPPEKESSTASIK